jgi:hypothetical protein
MGIISPTGFRNPRPLPYGYECCLFSMVSGGVRVGEGWRGGGGEREITRHSYLPRRTASPQHRVSVAYLS